MRLIKSVLSFLAILVILFAPGLARTPAGEKILREFEQHTVSLDLQIESNSQEPF